MSVTHYICKYTPVELLRAFGGECAILNHMPDNFDLSDQVSHPNICGFGKSLLEACMELNAPVYIRLGREATSSLYPDDVKYEIGKALIPREGDEKIGITYATEEEAELMGVAPESPLFWIISTTYDQDGQLMEYCREGGHPFKLYNVTPEHFEQLEGGLCYNSERTFGAYEHPQQAGPRGVLGHGAGLQNLTIRHHNFQAEALVVYLSVLGTQDAYAVVGQEAADSAAIYRTGVVHERVASLICVPL